MEAFGMVIIFLNFCAVGATVSGFVFYFWEEGQIGHMINYINIYIYIYIFDTKFRINELHNILFLSPQKFLSAWSE